MPRAKAWKQGAAGEPAFPDEFEVLHKAVLQVTDIKSNHNKYYALELHAGAENGHHYYRVFTHYGRTDDLERNPEAGVRESRYFDTQARAEGEFQSLYRRKTSPSKGYKEVSLASSKIGSQKSRGKSSGEVDAKTLERMAQAKKGKEPVKPKPSELDAVVQALVHLVYAEATSSLTRTVAAKITANGIETPLGVLTIGQIEKGEEILARLYAAFKKKRTKKALLETLSGEFYTVIPHRIGRTRAAIEAAVIDSLADFEQKQETLQLMKDMLSVNGEANVLLDPEIDKKYRALGCHIGALEKGSEAYESLARAFVKSQVRVKNLKVKNIYSLKRDSEWQGFRDDMGNQRLLYHGSRIRNWVGLLSRGVLLPKIAVSMGIGRTDAGWLGHGIYFGDAADTSAFYTTPSRKGTRLMAVHRVALGKMKDFRKITYGLSAPPNGYDSCHGVRSKTLRPSEFADDEYVIYDTRQQRQEYLVEFVGG